MLVMVHTITIFTAKNMAWKNTSSFESINTFINMNYEGLKDDVLSMLAGEKVRVIVNTFQNDLTTVATKDDALTALIHLGYLA